MLPQKINLFCCRKSTALILLSFTLEVHLEKNAMRIHKAALIQFYTDTVNRYRYTESIYIGNLIYIIIASTY